MASSMNVFIMLIGILECEGTRWRRQLQHITNQRIENEDLFKRIPARRFYQYDPRELSSIIGVPSRASHLPEAEAIQPGHTLLRPSLGMLKSALKFPHKELEDGAGVYGNIDNLGIKYDSRNERLMYSGFRRSPSDYIMVLSSPSRGNNEKPRFKLKTAVFDLDRRARAKNEILKILKKFNIPLKGVKVFVATENGDYLGTKSSTPKDLSYYFHLCNCKGAENSVFNVRDPYLPQEKNIQPNSIIFTYRNENIPKDVIYKSNERLLRTQKGNTNLKTPIKVDSSQETHTIPEDIRYKDENKIKKGSWINSMDTFNHIKIMQEAPELNELLSSTDDATIRKWWFYNADDYQPFLRKRYK